MANVRVRKGSRGVTYQAQVRMAGHRSLTKSFATRSAAKVWARDVESKLAKGDLADSEAVRRPLGEACDPVPRHAP